MTQRNPDFVIQALRNQRAASQDECAMLAADLATSQNLVDELQVRVAELAQENMDLKAKLLDDEDEAAPEVENDTVKQ